MTLIIPDQAGLVLHSLQLAGDAEPYAITYGIDFTGSSAADVALTASELHSAYHANINPTNPSSLTLIETLVKVKLTGTPDLIEGIDLTPHAGGGGSLSLVPQNTALLVHKRTAFGGRTGRGRMYFPALNEANVDSAGTISPAWLATMNTALSNWLTAVAGATYVTDMALLHDSAGAGAGLPIYAVTALGADPICATQRRRLRK